jgi:hypothetical protein
MDPAASRGSAKNPLDAVIKEQSVGIQYIYHGKWYRKFICRRTVRRQWQRHISAFFRLSPRHPQWNEFAYFIHRKCWIDPIRSSIYISFYGGRQEKTHTDTANPYTDTTYPYTAHTAHTTDTKYPSSIKKIVVYTNKLGSDHRSSSP